MTSTLRIPLLWLLLAMLGLATAAGLWAIPAGTELPVHWGLDGNPDRFWPRDWALSIAPVAVLAMIAVGFAVEGLGSKQQIARGRHLSRTVVLGLVALFAAVQTTIVLIGLGADVPMTRVLALGLGLLSVVIGNVLPKSQPNRFAGIRLPWTLASPVNWTSTHRLTGLLMMVTGVALVLLALGTSNATTLALATIAAMLLPAAVGSITSYRMARRRRAG